jgi:hypothetical protein
LPNHGNAACIFRSAVKHGGQAADFSSAAGVSAARNRAPSFFVLTGRHADSHASEQSIREHMGNPLVILERDSTY